MSLIVVYKVIQAFNKDKNIRVSKNNNKLVNTKYLKKISS